MKTIVAHAFLTGLHFPQREQGSSNLPSARVHLQDDRDCHKYRIAVPIEEAAQLVGLIQQDGDGVPRVRLTLEFLDEDQEDWPE